MGYRVFLGYDYVRLVLHLVWSRCSMIVIMTNDGVGDNGSMVR